MPARHEMVLTGHADSGAEEWFCPSCGRRMLMQWAPEFDTLLLDRGDDAAIHFGAKGGLRLDSMEVMPHPVGAVPEAETQWLLSNGIDWDGTSAA